MITTEIENTVREAMPEARDFEVIDSIPIPSKGDRMARTQVIEEALADFDRFENDQTRTYLVQLRPRSAMSDQVGTPTFAQTEHGLIDKMMRETFPQDAVEPLHARNTRMVASEPLYQPDGKLNSDYLFKNAEILFDAKEYQLSRKILTTILKAHERPAYSLFLIAKTYEAEGKLDEALKIYEQSLTFQPTIEAYQKTAALQMRAQKDQNAAETLERALLLKDLSVSVRCEVLKAIANSWFRAERPEKSVDFYRQALQLDPNSAWILCRLGLALHQLKQPGEAVQALNSALTLNPKNPQALNGIGLCLLDLGDKRAAHDAFARSLDIEIHNAAALYQLIKCAYELKSYATAARIVERYADVAPINAHLLYSLAGLQFHLGRMEDASRTIRKLHEIQPDHRGAADLHELIGKYAGASP